jgi:hypothetical protein
MCVEVTWRTAKLAVWSVNVQPISLQPIHCIGLQKQNVRRDSCASEWPRDTGHCLAMCGWRQMAARQRTLPGDVRLTANGRVTPDTAWRCEVDGNVERYRAGVGLGRVPKIAKRPLLASSCLSVCLSVVPDGTNRPPLDGVSWNLVLNGFFFRKYERKFHFLVISPQVVGFESFEWEKNPRAISVLQHWPCFCEIDKVHLQEYIFTIMNMWVAERQKVSAPGVLSS